MTALRFWGEVYLKCTCSKDLMYRKLEKFWYDIEILYLPAHLMSVLHITQDYSCCQPIDVLWWEEIKAGPEGSIPTYKPERKQVGNGTNRKWRF